MIKSGIFTVLTVLRVFYAAFRRFNDHDGWAIASHVALTTLISLFPFLIFITALAGFFGTEELADQATQMLLQTWPEQVAKPLAGQIRDVLTQNHSNLLTLGAALSLYFSSSGIEALRVGLDRAYDSRDKRPWWLARLLSIFFAFIGALALLALGFLIVLAPLIWGGILHFLPALHAFESEVTYARFAIAAALLLVALIIAHLFLPGGDRRLKDVAPGIGLTLGAWIGTAYLFGLYLSESARNYVNVYAGLASVMIVLGFLYWIGAIFIYGAELNAAIMQARDKTQDKAQDKANGGAKAGAA